MNQVQPAAYSLWSAGHRQVPFLHRNMRNADRRRQARIPTRASQRVVIPDSDESEVEARPCKRQKLAATEKNARARDKDDRPSHAVGDRSKTSIRRFDLLQIDVKSIVARADGAVTLPETQESVDIKCYVSIDHEEANMHAGTDNQYFILFRKSQNGHLTTTRQGDKIGRATVILPQPFDVPTDQITIGEDGDAESIQKDPESCAQGHTNLSEHRLAFWIHGRGRKTDWPPSWLPDNRPDASIADLLASSDTHKNLRLYCGLKLSDIPPGTCYNKRIALKLRSGRRSFDTSYDLCFSIGWKRATGPDSGDSGVESTTRDKRQVTRGSSKPSRASNDHAEQADANVFTCHICQAIVESTDDLSVHLSTQHSICSARPTKTPDEPRQIIDCQAGEIDGNSEETRPSANNSGNDDSLSSILACRSLAFRTEALSSSLSSLFTSPEPEFAAEEQAPSARPHEIPVNLRQDSLEVKIPLSKLPLPHTLTRRLLESGEVLSIPSLQEQNPWRRQEHRDIINDLPGFSADEKDYMIRWNEFIGQSTTADCYMPRAVRRFVALNCNMSSEECDANDDALSPADSWFAERASRARVWGVHVAALRLTGVLSFDDIWECSRMIEAARPPDGNEDINFTSSGSRKQKVKRGPVDCVCGKHVIPLGALLCTAKGCIRRFHHRECVSGSADGTNPVVRGWVCEICAANTIKYKR